MNQIETAHPKVVSQQEWLTERKKLLEHEKELTKHYDRVAAERRRLPMVKIEKSYQFEGPDGKQSLLDLFNGRNQLIVYHFMFAPEWDEGCGGCTFYVDAIADLSALDSRDARFILTSRAPLSKLEAYKAKKGWPFPWYSSFGSDFNYDFQATIDKNVAPPEYNYRETTHEGDAHALSVFFRIGDDVFHTYSSYARGVELIVSAMAMLDVTPYGRQQEFEDSPPGWPQKPTYG